MNMMTLLGKKHAPNNGGESLISPVPEDPAITQRRLDDLRARDGIILENLQNLKIELDKFMLPSFTVVRSGILIPELARLEKKIADKLDEGETIPNLDRLTGQRNEIKFLMSRADALQSEILANEDARQTILTELSQLDAAMKEKEP